MRGKYSETLSSLFLTVAIILLVVGLITKVLSLSILLFLVFFLIEEMALRGILSIASNAPRGVLYSIPLVFLSGFLISYLITAWDLQSYFIWFVILLIGSGTFGLNQKFKEARYMFMADEASREHSREEVRGFFNEKKKRYLVVFSIYVLLIIVVFWYFNKGISLTDLI
jgi:dolichyl-phosphate-mannose--protein O-mannosyl transferase